MDKEFLKCREELTEKLGRWGHRCHHSWCQSTPLSISLCTIEKCFRQKNGSRKSKMWNLELGMLTGRWPSSCYRQLPPKQRKDRRIYPNCAACRPTDLLAIEAPPLHFIEYVTCIFHKHTHINRGIHTHKHSSEQALSLSLETVGREETYGNNNFQQLPSWGLVREWTPRMETARKKRQQRSSRRMARAIFAPHKNGEKCCILWLNTSS